MSHKLTAPPWLAEAQQLRARRFTYRAIAERLREPEGRVYYWLNRERSLDWSRRWKRHPLRREAVLAAMRENARKRRRREAAPRMTGTAAESETIRRDFTEGAK